MRPETTSELLLADARAPRSDPVRAGDAIEAALRDRPHDRTVRLAAYKFHFYAARLAAARPHALWCLDDAARALGLPLDWRTVTPRCADFASLDAGPRRFLECLVALGYIEARLGRSDAALAILDHAARLDCGGAFPAARLAAVVRRGGADPDDAD